MQRHTAHYQGRAVTIRYPFHPRCGEQVSVFRRHSFRGLTMLVVRQPDGTLAHVPEWMCAPTAAEAAIRDGARFPLEVLQELRTAADAALAFLSGCNDGRGHDTARTSCAARPIRIARDNEQLAAGGQARDAGNGRNIVAGGNDREGGGEGGRR